MAACITRIQSPHNFLLNHILTFSNDLFIIFMSKFEIHSGEETATYTSFLQVYFYTSLLTGSQLNFLCFDLQFVRYLPVNSHFWDKPEADVSHSISVPLNFLQVPNGIFQSKVENAW
jgi:hypothetical protein